MDTTWTLVTGYFDLTTMSDASDAIRNRPADHYLANATATLAVDRPLIVFCEPAYLDKLKAIRPSHLHEKTRFVVMSFEDFPLTKYRDQLLENRKTNPSPDSRNTASYYLFCMSRYAMLKQAIRENPFGSTHFAWVFGTSKSSTASSGQPETSSRRVRLTTILPRCSEMSSAMDSVRCAVGSLPDAQTTWKPSVRESKRSSLSS